jgi:hypothetical protein
VGKMFSCHWRKSFTAIYDQEVTFSSVIFILLEKSSMIFSERIADFKKCLRKSLIIPTGIT